MITAGVYGATGYAGYQLVRILLRHPDVGLRFITSRTYAGQRLSDVFPCFCDLTLVQAEDAPLSEVQVAFLCLPHGASMEPVKRVREAGARVIDLSADFRLHDVADYMQWYKKAHVVPELLPEAIYGLTEVYREQIRDAQLVANPGCYPTGVLLALYPAASEGLLSDERIIVDAKSGASGAGRSLNLKTHFVEANENFSPYAIGHVHRHISEMEQELRQFGGHPYQVTFSPHLLPVNNGILSTIYVTASADRKTLINIYERAYVDEPFVHILDDDRLASLRHVVGTNHCVISITQINDRGHFIIVSAIDNLIKGASGQAVQNMNVMFGLDERTGLEA
ncbi:MAG: N-acetyl-gamma-glutamyl-phosphate reductase [Anaerolineae bacterium]|nr:N-acetyl-gamma-glutamyl-phosphate reductase [Anaerolineae bacterium]